jgi:hypothetical protein
MKPVSTSRGSAVYCRGWLATLLGTEAESVMSGLPYSSL